MRGCGDYGVWGNVGRPLIFIIFINHFNVVLGFLCKQMVNSVMYVFLFRIRHRDSSPLVERQVYRCESPLMPGVVTGMHVIVHVTGGSLSECCGGVEHDGLPLPLLPRGHTAGSITTGILFFNKGVGIRTFREQEGKKIQRNSMKK